MKIIDDNNHIKEIAGTPGREQQKMNNLFYICGLIEYVARKTKNERKVIVNALGRKRLTHYFEFADVYHCENIDKITEEIVEDYHISVGTYDNLSLVHEKIPTHWEIGRVMQRLIVEVAEHTKTDVIEALIMVYNSWIVPKIDNYNSSMYYENTSYQYASYEAGMAL